jgi:hypothetical protein
MDFCVSTRQRDPAGAWPRDRKLGNCLRFALARRHLPGIGYAPDAAQDAGHPAGDLSCRVKSF